MVSQRRFVADAMLGSLARKLRIFGYDTLYFKAGEDAELEGLAKSEGRTLLTSDRLLYAHSRRKGVGAFLLEGSTDRARLLSVMRQAGPSMHVRQGGGRSSRCAICNGELAVISKKDAAVALVPSKVIARHRLFYECGSCSRCYWHGGHWERLRRLARSLETKDLT